MHVVETGAVPLVQPGNQGKHEKILTAVGVAGQLQVVAQGGMQGRIFGLMGHQDAECLGSAGPSRHGIRRHQPGKARGIGIGHSGDDQGHTVDHKYTMLVEQHGQPLSTPGPHPGHDARIIFVIAHDNQHAVFGLQFAEQFHVLAHHGGPAVHQIAGDQHEVRGHSVGAFHNLAQPQSIECGPHMQIAELGNTQPVKLRRQRLHGNFQLVNARHPQGTPHKKGGCKYAASQ